MVLYSNYVCENWRLYYIYCIDYSIGKFVQVIVITNENVFDKLIVAWFIYK